MIVINPDQLTPGDLELISEILNDYLEYFDAEEEMSNGVDNPQAKLEAVESLYGRLEGVDLSAPDSHEDECHCDWCEIVRQGSI